MCYELEWRTTAVVYANMRDDTMWSEATHHPSSWVNDPRSGSEPHILLLADPKGKRPKGAQSITCRYFFKMYFFIVYVTPTTIPVRITATMMFPSIAIK